MADFVPVRKVEDNKFVPVRKMEDFIPVRKVEDTAPSLPSQVTPTNIATVTPANVAPVDTEQQPVEESLLRKLVNLPFVKQQSERMFGKSLPVMEKGSEDLLKGLERGDVVVESLIKKFDPNITPESVSKQSLPEFLVKDYSRQVLADFARFYKPTSYLTFEGAGKAIQPLVKGVGAPVVKAVWNKIPENIRKVLLKNLTIGKGQPQAYQALAEKARLEKMAGEKEAKKVLDILSTTKNPMLYTSLKTGKEVLIKAGKPLSLEQQIHLGRIFRGEVSLSGMKSRLLQPQEKVARIMKEIEVNVAFNPEVNSLQMELSSINKALRNKVKRAEALEAAPALERKELLLKRKIVAEKLEKKVIGLENKIRSKYDIFDKTFVNQIKNNPRYIELAGISAEGRQIMDKWSKALIKSGIPTEEAKKIIEENIGSYMPRMFKSRLPGEAPLGYGYKDMRLRLNGLKHRKNLSAEVLKEMAEIKEPALPVAIRTKELSTTVANANLFSRVADNPEWSNIAPIYKDWVKMPDTATMGALRNKYVIPEIAHDINGVIGASSQGFETYLKILSAWKYGKVVLNPATHARNIMSNSMLLDFSGMNHLRQAYLAPRVLVDYYKKGKYYQEAVSTSLLSSDFFSVEAKQFLDNGIKSTTQSGMIKLLDMTKVPFRKLGDLYQFEEQFFKMMKFTDMRMKGATVEQAFTEAEKWIFNYNKIPKIIDFTRKFGSPFITFTYKAIPRIAETMVNNPIKLYKYYAFFNAFNNASAKSLGMTPKQIEEDNKYLPDYMKMKIPGIPSNLLMPVRDKYGGTQYLNLEYILPVGMAPEIAERGILDGVFSNPFVNIIGEIKSNRDFLGREIVGKGFSPLEANLKMAEHAYRQLAPSFAPNIGSFKGGYSWEKLRDSLHKRGDYIGRVREPGQVLFDVLAGLKVTPVNIQEQKMFQRFEKESDVKVIMNELKKTKRHMGIGEEEKEKKRAEVMERIGRIINK